MNAIVCQPRPVCPLCASHGAAFVSDVCDPDAQLQGSWSFHCCRNKDCAVIWLDPAPAPEELWKAYANYHTHTKARSGKLGKAMLSLAHRFIRLFFYPLRWMSGLKKEADIERWMALADEPVGKVLDVGCGGGRFLARMKKRGWKVEGTDFDHNAAQKVTQKYGIKTHVGDLPECGLNADDYDAITLNQAIEHLYDPKATLAECYRLLKPGGLLVMTTPNPRSIGAMLFGQHWRGWEAPRHLFLYSVDALQQLSVQAGFMVMKADTYSAGSAVVYRVSYEISQQHGLSWGQKAGALLKGYRHEFAEYQAQKDKPHSGQNVICIVRKPSL